MERIDRLNHPDRNVIKTLTDKHLTLRTFWTLRRRLHTSEHGPSPLPLSPGGRGQGEGRSFQSRP